LNANFPNSRTKAATHASFDRVRFLVYRGADARYNIWNRVWLLGDSEEAAHMADDLIRYDILVQDALRGVMRRILHEVSQSGLPGEHHFFITFETGAPGVRISARLKERYPEQMTIVVQFQFWDLKVTDHGFEIGLSFNDIAEKLVIPFAAVRGFYDPSVNFELEFDAPAVSEAEVVELIEAPTPAASPMRSIAGKKSEKPETGGEISDDASADAAQAPVSGGAQVVSLDSFRQKK
jgi:uncharacterized protein